MCLIQNLYFQGFETPKEYIASQGKFYLNKNILFLIQCITTCMYVVDRCLFLDRSIKETFLKWIQFCHKN